MQNTFLPPRPGEECILLCENCKKEFRGKNPGGARFIIFSGKTKCPFCGSRKVIVHPGVCY